MSYFWLRFLAILVSKLCYGLKYRKEFAFYVIHCYITVYRNSDKA